VNELEIVFVDQSWKFAEEIPAGIDLCSGADAIIELVTGPVNRSQRHVVEPIGIEQGRLVVIAQDHPFAARHDQIKALARIRSVANDVTQAIDLRDILGFNVGQHRLERLEVAVDVADQSSLHEVPLDGGWDWKTSHNCSRIVKTSTIP
jgi:hypothetical protein